MFVGFRIFQTPHPSPPLQKKSIYATAKPLQLHYTWMYTLQYSGSQPGGERNFVTARGEYRIGSDDEMTRNMLLKCIVVPF